MTKEHETQPQHTAEREAQHGPSHGAKALQAALEKQGVTVLGVVEPPDTGLVTLTLAVGGEPKDFTFNEEDATADEVLKKFLGAGGRPTPKEPPKEAV